MIKFVLALLVLAAVLYGIFWAIDRRNSGGSGGSPARPKPRGPVGPDDDEAFLRNLEREQRRRRNAQKNAEKNAPKPDGTNPKRDPDPNPPQANLPGEQ